jgi:NAD(P)-dependent dehydrogenase (short-subunit alcohol dehydrogenase family)
MGYLEEQANLRGRTAAVIGGGAGVGGAVTMALANAGVDIVFCDIDAEAVDTTSAAVEQVGPRVMGRVTDACDLEQLVEFYGALDDTVDHLDILVNVVGGVERRAFPETTFEQMNADVHRNLVWAMQSMRLAIPRIRASGRGGSIISFTTIEAHRGAAGYAAYAGAKAGLVNFSRALAVELGRERIRVNLVAPDTTPSRSIERKLTPEALRRAGTTPELMAKGFGIYIPMGTPPPVEALGNAVLFLASDLSASITGTTLHVDGGTFAASGFLRWPDSGWGPTPILRESAAAASDS